MILPLALALSHLAAPAVLEPSLRVELIAVGALPAHTPLDRFRVGGLSGLAYLDGRWLAVTDDKEDAPRLYELQIDVDPAARSLSARVIGVHTLASEDLTDAEAVALSPEAVFVAFERPCAVGAFEFPARQSPAGAPLRLTQRFTTPEPVASRTRKNRAFESIILRPAKTAPEVWAFTESATYADGAEASPTQGAISRAVAWRVDQPDRSRQYAYESLPRPANTLLVLPSYNSLVDAAAIDADRFLTLERSFSVAAGYDAAIRLITLSNNESDLTTIPALDPRPDDLIPLRVETIATLQSLGAPSTVNYEGLAIGPSLNDARAGRLLIILADDNFGADGQPTNAVLGLRLLEPPTSTRSGTPADDR